MQALFIFLVLGVALGMNSADEEEIIVHYTKHLRACTYYLEMYSKWACIHEFSITQ